MFRINKESFSRTLIRSYYIDHLKLEFDQPDLKKTHVFFSGWLQAISQGPPHVRRRTVLQELADALPVLDSLEKLLLERNNIGVTGAQAKGFPSRRAAPRRPYTSATRYPVRPAQEGDSGCQTRVGLFFQLSTSPRTPQRGTIVIISDAFIYLFWTPHWKGSACGTTAPGAGWQVTAQQRTGAPLFSSNCPAWPGERVV